MKPRISLWLIIILVLFVILVDIPRVPVIHIPKTKFSFNFSKLSDSFPIRLGLDLQGGTELTLQTDMSKIAPVSRDDALEGTRIVIERRVNAFGVSEASVVSARVGDDRRILVDLPGVKDASDAASLVGKTAQLDFREQGASHSAFFQKTNLTGADLQKADVVYNQSHNRNAGPQVSIEFNSEGAKKFEEITKRNVGKPLAIFLDNDLIKAPVVQQEIIGGNAVISGNFTPEQAKNLAIQLNAGALPVPIHILSQRSVSATLGAESVTKSLVAGIIGLGIVIAYMFSYYGLLGLLADLSLIIYALLVLAIFKSGFFVPQLQVTLTLSGIAGFILSIGMAVDANILIFERMKEEKRWGKLPKHALELGFSRAWSSIRDSNVSTLVTAAILYYFSNTGLVKGFAITLGIGVLVSMFTAVVITKTFLRLFIK